MSFPIKTDRLHWDFIRKVCWPKGKDHSQYCRYLRAYKGRWICAKGTPAGIIHDQRMQRYMETFDDIPVTLSVPDDSEDKPPIKLEDVLHDAGKVPFIEFPRLAPKKKPTEYKQVEARMRVHAGDNCPGRADEFVHLFEDEID